MVLGVVIGIMKIKPKLVGSAMQARTREAGLAVKFESSGIISVGTVKDGLGRGRAQGEENPAL